MVVADTTPVHYLLLIGEIEILPRLYGCVAIPETVRGELTKSNTPAIVRNWAAATPEWVRVFVADESAVLPFANLGAGERQAIALATRSERRLLLTDDAEARVAAGSVGIQTVPTIRLLSTASALGMLDFDTALARLLVTNFRVSPKVIKQVREQTSVKSI